MLLPAFMMISGWWLFSRYSGFLRKTEEPAPTGEAEAEQRRAQVEYDMAMKERKEREDLERLQRAELLDFDRRLKARELDRW